MKVSSLTSACLFFFLFATGQAKNDLQKANLKGKVKSVIEATYSLSENGRKDGLIAKHSIIYNNKGNEAIWNKYQTSDGVYYGKIISIYDAKGKKTGKIDSSAEGVYNGKYVYKFDSKDNSIEQIYTSPDASFTLRETYKPDDKGNMIEKNEYKEDGKLNMKTTYKYDDMGREIEEVAELDITLSQRTVLKYDAHGDILEQSAFNQGDGKLLSKYTFKYLYDKTGNWISQTSIENGKATEVTDRVIVYY